MSFEIIKPTDLEFNQFEWKTFNNILRELQYETRQIANECSKLWWEWTGLSSDYYKIHSVNANIKDITGHSMLIGLVADKFKGIGKNNSGNISTTIKQIIDALNKKKSSIMRGEESLPSFLRNNIPIDIKGQNIKITANKQDYYATLSLLSNPYKKELELDKGKFNVLLKINRDNNKKAIINRILSGEYKICASKLVKRKDKNKKDKWFLNLCYSFEPKKLELNPENVVGIDVGIKMAVVAACSNSFRRLYIEGSEIRTFRKKTEKVRIQLLRQTKYCGNGRIGHGRYTRIKPTEHLSEKVKNFRNLTNDKYSKAIVNFAIQNNCGTIHMEDLTGINKFDNFLANWSYYDLQQKIKNKAGEKGIVTKYINPKYTSQKCNKCGYTDSGNRPKKEKGQAYFKCLECGFETNADYNAARNIAMSDAFIKK